jgi:hypothetical protein
VPIGEIYNQDLVADVKADKSLPPDTQSALIEKLNRKTESVEAKDSRQAYPELFEATRQGQVLAWLLNSSIALSFSQMEADNGSLQSSLGVYDYHIPLFGQSSPTAQLDIAEGKRQTAAAESDLRTTLKTYTTEEYRAIQDISLNHHQGAGIMKSLAEDKSFSPETRAFIADLNNKTGF